VKDLAKFEAWLKGETLGVNETIYRSSITWIHVAASDTKTSKAQKAYEAAQASIATSCRHSAF
jgi:hypothetical protein